MDVKLLTNVGDGGTPIAPVVVEEMHQGVNESVPLARSIISTPIPAVSAAAPTDVVSPATDAMCSSSSTVTDEDAVGQRKRHHQRIMAEAFRTQDHSLRISASNIAACCGYHPFKSLPTLLHELVYQGFAGRALLRQDTALLGMELVHSDQQLRDLANRAGVSAAVEDVLGIKDGSKIVPTVEAATKIKDDVIQKAARILSKEEMKVFRDGIRDAVNTGYGTAHEDNGLDLYETKTGWQVGQRNAEVRAWPFRKESDHSVAPMGNAMPTTRSIRTEFGAAIPKRSKLVCDLTDDANQDITFVDEVEQPFFLILGSVDGIRDELAPGCEADDDSWVIRRVIVECKHRMRRLQQSPPLYEQIQTTAYCLMHGVTEADIVQVLRLREGKVRSSEPSHENESGAEFVLESDDKGPKLVATGTDMMSTDCDSGVLTTSKSQESANAVEAEAPVVDGVHVQSQVPVDDSNDTTENFASKKGPETDIACITISISRISIDDELMQHRKHWHEIILPRLRMFVEAVYKIRRDDDKRYRLLASVADRSTAYAWQILFDECPWLETCDTAFCG